MIRSVSTLSRTMYMVRSSPPTTAAMTIGNGCHHQSRTMAAMKTTFDLPDPSSTSTATTTSTSNPQQPYHYQRPLVKIVATIGPTSEQEVPLYHCVQSGINSMRLNFSHATSDEVELRCSNLHKAITQCTHDKTSLTTTTSSSTVVPIQDVVSVLLDTKGPELRTGKLANDTSGHDTVELVTGASITLHGSMETIPNGGGSTATDLYIPFPVLASVLQPNRTVLLDDGAIVLTVLSTDVSNNTVSAIVQNTGHLRSRAGVNLPLADTAQHLPALSTKDQADITYGMTTADIDYVAASFVQTAQHVIDIRRHMIACAQSLPELWKDKPLPLIISKIETASALQHFDSILEVSDGIMVARGDVCGTLHVLICCLFCFKFCHDALTVKIPFPLITSFHDCFFIQ
jgi:pyruvate kinase